MLAYASQHKSSVYCRSLSRAQGGRARKVTRILTDNCSALPQNNMEVHRGSVGGFVKRIVVSKGAALWRSVGTFDLRTPAGYGQDMFVV